MKARHILGAIFVLIVGAILAYIGVLTYLQYQTTGDLDWPLILRGKGFSGTIVSVSDDSIELESVNGKREKFDRDKGTRIILGEDKLEPGLFVKVIYKETKQRNIAKAIRKVKAPEDLKKTDDTKVKPEETPMKTPGGDAGKPEAGEEKPRVEPTSDVESTKKPDDETEKNDKEQPSSDETPREEGTPLQTEEKAEPPDSTVTNTPQPVDPIIKSTETPDKPQEDEVKDSNENSDPEDEEKPADIEDKKTDSDEDSEDEKKVDENAPGNDEVKEN